jgi:hypothetical protein
MPTTSRPICIGYCLSLIGPLAGSSESRFAAIYLICRLTSAERIFQRPEIGSSLNAIRSG